MTHTRIGFTGTQHGMTEAQLITLRKLLSGTLSVIPVAMLQFHHGDCIGADTQAHHLVKEHHPDTVIFIHPPINKAKASNLQSDVIIEPKEYLDRNHDIVDATDLLVATPGQNTEELRSGTWATVRYARKTKKSLAIITPDGRLVVEWDIASAKRGVEP